MPQHSREAQHFSQTRQLFSARRHRPPLSPEAAAIVRAQLAGGGGLSRRGLLGGAGALGLGALLSACGTAGTETASAAPKAAIDHSGTEKVVNWANWTLYLDFDDKTKTYPTLQRFQKDYGITATYDEAIEDNDSYYGKVQGQLKNGQDIGKDIIVFTDWMAARVIRQGYVQKLDHTKIPNIKNLLPGLRQPDFDPGRNYSLTWQSGYAGLAWNKNLIPKGLTNVSDLWAPALKGKVEVLSEFRDTLGLIMLEQGVDISKFTAAQYSASLEVLQKQLDSGQIRQVKGNSYKEDLISKDAWAVIGWSGDITQINAENGDQWDFVLPEAGGTLWSDNMQVPVGSPHKQNAETLMNYYYDPKVAAEVAAYVQYICPVEGAQEEMAKSSTPELATNKWIFPTAKDQAAGHIFRSLTPAEETSFTADFQKVLGV